MNESLDNKNALKEIKNRLIENLGALYVEVIDKSALHAGHFEKPTQKMNYGQDIESTNTENIVQFPENIAISASTHLHIIISSPQLSKLSQVEAHRKIYANLHKEFEQGLHAVSIEIKNIN